MGVHQPMVPCWIRRASVPALVGALLLAVALTFWQVPDVGWRLTVASALRQGAPLAVAVERHVARHGAPPATLAELAPSELAQPPAPGWVLVLWDRPEFAGWTLERPLAAAPPRDARLVYSPVGPPPGSAIELAGGWYLAR